MRAPLRLATITCLVLFVTIGVGALAQRATPPASTPPSTSTPASTAASTKAAGETIARIVASAQAVATTLDDAGRGKVQFAFDGPQKTRWSNLPSPMFQRDGVRLADLTASQRKAVMNLLAVALSKDGYRKVTEIMHGDELLKRPGGGGPMFGEDQYWVAFVGTPSATAPWMLQFGGHHLAINLTMAGSDATMAPSLPAAQPATYTVEGRTVRPLGNENDKAFALVNALDATQRTQAVLSYRVSDLVLGPGQDGRTIQPEGIKASALTPPQQAMLWDVVREWVGIMNDAFAEPRMAELKTHLAETYFAWSGATTNGSPSYFRVQGPTLVIEYAPQGGSVDHIHTIYRDPTNDYGAKYARR
jgi:hypothetical protein